MSTFTREKIKRNQSTFYTLAKLELVKLAECLQYYFLKSNPSIKNKMKVQTDQQRKAAALNTTVKLSKYSL